jgi:ElaB/YqjD/DUF883 family membrane-anchored ribosome-binding protein
MNKQKHTISDAMDTLAEDARNLMNATTDVAEEKVGEARKRLSTTLERGREIYDSIRKDAVGRAKVFNEATHEHPYKAIAIGFGAGAFIGYLVARNAGHNHQSS